MTTAVERSSGKLLPGNSGYRRGKAEVGRFTRNEVESYEIREKAFKSIVWIRFRDGEEFSFTLKDIELATAFKTFMED